MPKRKSVPRKPRIVPQCPVCANLQFYSCAGFSFSGEERLEKLVALLASHPELARELEGRGWEN